MQAAALTRVVVGAYSKGETACFADLFHEVETAIDGGTALDHDLAIVGFVELRA